MKILKFTLSGQFAFFKNPEVNSVCYFTFNNIHKVALMGIFGAILGLKGYNQQGDDEYPEFYDKLKNLSLSVVPNGEVCPNKKIQIFNNSTMFYNQGKNSRGANLIVKEEWIENPSWDIYVKIDEDNEIENELLTRITLSRYVYIPYLGKNDHFANIMDVQVFKEDEIELLEESEFKLDSFYLRECYTQAMDDFFDEGDNVFIYKEHLPFGLTSQTNHYEYKVVEYSTGNVEPINDTVKTYKINDLNLSFI